jgi:hypothetical protein
MSPVLSLELDPARTAQVQLLSGKLGISPEAVLELALNLAIGEWKEVVPELTQYETEPAT